MIKAHTYMRSCKPRLCFEIPVTPLPLLIAPHASTDGCAKSRIPVYILVPLMCETMQTGAFTMATINRAVLPAESAVRIALKLLCARLRNLELKASSITSTKHGVRTQEIMMRKASKTPRLSLVASPVKKRAAQPSGPGNGQPHPVTRVAVSNVSGGHVFAWSTTPHGWRR